MKKLSYLLLLPFPVEYVLDKLGYVSIVFPVILLAALIVGFVLLAKEKDDKRVRRRAWIGIGLNAYAVTAFFIGVWAMIHYHDAFAAGAGTPTPSVQQAAVHEKK